MSAPYTITTVEELRAGVGELLLRVYVDEWGKQLPPAPSRRARRAPSRTLIALDRGRVVGTARLTLGSSLPADEQRRLRLEHFAAALPLEQTAVGGRLAIAAPLRASGLALDLVKASARAAVESGVRLLFTACQPHLLNLYGQLGFSPYAPVVSKEGVGVLAPVVLDLTDRERLVRRGSPLQDVVVGEASARTLRDVITSTPGHEARCRGPDELGDVFEGPGPLSQLAPTVASALRRSAHLVPVGPGDLVVSRGQAVRTLYLVLDGTIHVVDAGEPVQVVERGGFAGEVSYLLGVRQRHDLYAGPDGARLLALPVAAFADEVAAEAFLMILVDALRRRRSRAQGGVS